MKTKIILVVLVLVVGCIPWIHPLAAHATGLIYISPSSSTVQVGDTVTVALRIDPGTAVNSVQATVGYDPSALQYDSTSLGVFSSCPQNSGGGGSVILACAILGSTVSTDSLIANITFTALASSGSTTLSVSGQNAANDGSYTDPGASGGTVGFTSPPSSGGGGGGNSNSGGSSRGSSKSVSSTNNSSSNSNSSPSTPAPAPAAPVVPPPKLSASSLESLQFNNASFKFTASEPVQAYLIYGTSKNDLNLITQPTGFGTSGTVSLGTNLTPGTTYYYKLVVKDTAGAYVESSLKSLTTKGYTVVVTILDNAYKPLANKVVTLHSTPLTATTNSKGVATFTDVAPGLHHVDYTVSGVTYSQPTYVLDNMTTATKSGTQSAPTQYNAVVLSNYTQSSGKSVSMYLIWAVTVIALLVAWRFVVMMVSDRQRNFAHYTSAILPKHGKSHA